MFAHFLITRFNIRITGQGPEYMTSPAIDQKWLDERLSYFYNYSLPSVLAQQNKNFTWLIYFDIDTPEHLINSLMNQLNPFPHIKIILTEHFEMMLDDIKLKFQHCNEKYVISSRMDNDDIISRDYIQRVQSSFIPKDKVIINFLAGYELDLHKKVLRKWNASFKNQFISIIESAQSGAFLTIYGFPHWKLPQNAEIINLSESPGWIHLRHSMNYTTQAEKGIPVFKKSVLRNFPEAVQRINLSFTQTCRYMFRWLPIMLRRRSKNIFRL